MPTTVRLPCKGLRPRGSQHSARGALRGAVADAVQGLLAGLTPNVFTDRRTKDYIEALALTRYPRS